MSITASIDINLKNNNNKLIPSIEIIRVLINNGWTLVHNNYVSYLPLGDKDSYDWQDSQNMNIDDLAVTFYKKERAEETVGIMMTWKDTFIGGDFLFWPSKIAYPTLSINLNADRPLIALTDNYKIIDFQYYLLRLLPPLNDEFCVEGFSFEYQQ